MSATSGYLRPVPGPVDFHGCAAPLGAPADAWAWECEECHGCFRRTADGWTKDHLVLLVSAVVSRFAAACCWLHDAGEDQRGALLLAHQEWLSAQHWCLMAADHLWRRRARVRLFEWEAV